MGDQVIWFLRTYVCAAYKSHPYDSDILILWLSARYFSTTCKSLEIKILVWFFLIHKESLILQNCNLEKPFKVHTTTHTDAEHPSCTTYWAFLLHTRHHTRCSYQVSLIWFPSWSDLGIKIHSLIWITRTKQTYCITPETFSFTYVWKFHFFGVLSSPQTFKNICETWFTAPYMHLSILPETTGSSPSSTTTKKGTQTRKELSGSWNPSHLLSQDHVIIHL